MIGGWVKLGFGVAIVSAVGFGWMHYNGLLKDREALHDAVADNKTLKKTIEQQLIDIALIDTISQELGEIKQGLSEGKRERRRITLTLVEQNAEYKTWRDNTFPGLVNERLQSRANAINRDNQGQGASRSNSQASDPAEE